MSLPSDPGPDTRLIVPETRVTGMERVTFGIRREQVENTNFLLPSRLHTKCISGVPGSAEPLA